jgi:hypothetical protein
MRNLPFLKPNCAYLPKRPPPRRDETQQFETLAVWPIRRCMKPVVMWNAKKPNSQRTTKSATIIASITPPVTRCSVFPTERAWSMEWHLETQSRCVGSLTRLASNAHVYRWNPVQRNFPAHDVLSFGPARNTWQNACNRFLIEGPESPRIDALPLPAEWAA